MESYNEESDKKREFSKFQTENMIYKLKKIKKKKKKQLDNYKNIETLKNIHEDFDEFEQNDFPKNDNKEGFGIIPPIQDDQGRYNYDGYDTVNDNGASTTDPRQAIVNAINDVYNTIIALNHWIAYTIAKGLSKNKATNNEVLVIQKYIGWFFSILLSCFVVFNWYFVMFYENSFGKKVDLFDFSRHRLKTLSETNPFWEMLDFVIHFAVFFPEKLEQYTVKTIPWLVSTTFNSTLCFTLLFFFMILVFYNFANSARQFFIDIIMFNTKNSSVMLMYTFVVLLFIASFLIIDFTVKYAVHMVSLYNPFNFMYSFIIGTIRLIIILMVSVPLGGLFCMIYILFYSFFAIIHYSNWNFTDAYYMFKKISKYAEESKNSIHKGSNCKPNTLFEHIMNFINIIFDYIYQYSYYIAVIYMLIFATWDYFVNINNSSLKTSMIIINSIIIVICIQLCVLYYKPPATKEAIVLEKIVTPAKVPNVVTELPLQETI